MKKLCYSAFIAFWSSIATLLAVQALATDDSTRSKAAAAGKYTLAEVAAHADNNSCWVAIDGGVYDLTGYLDKHPAPPMILAGWCGKEATEGMRTKGYGRDHSPAAWELLESYRIGELVE